MKILLDTTYLLPLIGISVEGIPDDMLLRLINRRYKIYINYIALFELSAKGAKYIAQGKLMPDRVLRGINALIHDERVKKIKSTDTDVLMTAFRLRTKIVDFIDCLILSTALHYCDILLTEDEELHELRDSTWFNEFKEGINPDIRVMSYTEFAKRHTRL